MTKEDLYNAVSGIDADLIEQAEKPVRTGRKNITRTIIAAAAGVILIAGAAALGWQMLKPAQEPEIPGPVDLLAEAPSSVSAETTPAAGDNHLTAGEDLTDVTPEPSASDDTSPVINLACFTANGKAEAVQTLQQSAESYYDACRAGTMEEFAEKYPATADAFWVYKDRLTSEYATGDLELFYIWLFPDRFAETGVDTLLIGIRSRYELPEFFDSLNTGELIKNPEYEEGKKSDWWYTPGFFYLYDANSGECTRMDTLQRDRTTGITVLRDKSLFLEHQITSPDEEDPTIRWNTQMERIISFDETGYPVLEENLPIYKYANAAEGYSFTGTHEEFEALHPEEYYPESNERIEELINAHGGIYQLADDLSAIPGVEFGILYSNH